MQKRTRQGSDNGQKTAASAVDHLNDVLGTFTTLQHDAQRLLGQLGESLRQMRELRSQLQEHRTKPGQTRKAHLQNRYGLTIREAEVAALLGKGKSNSAIASALNISPHTARHHTQKVLAKLEVHSRAEAGVKVRG